MPETPPSLQIQARWSLDPASMPVFANQVLVQAGPPANGRLDSIYLTFGHINPPFVDTAQIGVGLSQEDVAGVVFPVLPVARVALTLEKLLEMRAAIDNFLQSSGIEVSQQ
jgi:hypothetical protein